MGFCRGMCLSKALRIDQELTLSLSQAHVAATSVEPFISHATTFVDTPGLRSEVIHVVYSS